MASIREEPPLTGGHLDNWTAGLDDVAAAVACVVAGVDARALERWLAAKPSRSLPRFLIWRWDDALRLRNAADLLDRDTGRLASGFYVDSAHSQHPPPARLAVTGNVLPAEVVPRLLACPGVGSAVVPVQRAPGALRRRAWHWPLRIGVADDELREAFATQQQGHWPLPPTLVDVTDVRAHPGGVDLLVLRGTPAEAATFTAERRQLASVVLCAGDSGGAWPVIDAYLALMRAATGAVATALAPPDSAMEVAQQVRLTLRYLTHGHPLDVALTAAFDRHLLVTAETDALVDASLPAIIRQWAKQHRFDIEGFSQAMSAPPARGSEPPQAGAEPLGRGAEALDAIDTMKSLSHADFSHEYEEASRVVEPVAAAEAALDVAEAASPRLLQAWVGPFAAVGVPDNVLRPRANAVDVFIGPEELGALAGREVTDEALGFTDPAINRVRLTVVLAPLIPRGEPRRAELDVPRSGRSGNARLRWDLPGVGHVQARLLVIHRNRLIQTAVLSGDVGGSAELRERLVLWESFGHLDDQQAFDRTFVLNHDDDGTATIVMHADGVTKIGSMEEILKISDTIREHLLRATQLRSTTSKAAAEEARKILVYVAIAGQDLCGKLERHLGRLRGDRLQIVTARSARFLPLELVYDRPAPELDARLCQNWLDDKPCGSHCFADADPADPDDTSVVCPAVFWGMSRVIERQYKPATDPKASPLAHPTRTQHTLRITRAVLAASEKVDVAEVEATRTMLRVAAERMTTWTGWRAALANPASSPADLLLLMPHTDANLASLEISRDIRMRGQIEEWHVTGRRAVHPLVVLFGCDTAGSEEDPEGYSGRFISKGAAVVISTLTMLRNTHAVAMSQQLAALLVKPERREEPLGELVARFRRDAVRSGLISALSVTAYGDAGWTV